ncbi:MAG: FMN-binding protein [SAR324 cluster bacterium]|nr:FMN-binding protein [SAR324 cluster bacterium]MBL7034530.1 FMN-binding protein [SAR324 cluster bacterium]
MVELQQNRGSSSLRLIATLGVAGLFSGLALVAVFLFTRPLIEANQAEALRIAIFQVLPGSESYKTLELNAKKLQLLSNEKESTGPKKSNPRIYAGYSKSGDLLGFAIPGEEPGFQDKIKAIFGYDPEQRMLIGFEVLDTKETPGLGDKIIKDKYFRSSLTTLKIDPKIVAVKPGQKTAANQVETITGATISSKTVIRLLEKTIRWWLPSINKYLETQ